MEKKILQNVAVHGETSRTQIARSAMLSLASVSRGASSLTAQGLLVEGNSEAERRGRGRPRKYLSVNPALGTVTGIDLGVNFTRVVVADIVGHVFATTRTRTKQSDAETLWENVYRSSRELSLRREPQRFDHVCVAVPGAVAGDVPRITNAPNLPGIEGTMFINSANRSLENPLAIDNDANMALTAELLVGAARDASSASMVTIGTGLGTAISINRQILRGARGLVGEFGQLTLGAENRKLEESIAGNGLMNLAKSFNLNVDRPADLFARPSTHGDPILANFHASLLTVLTALAVASDPDVIIVGGGIGHGLRDNFRRYEASIKKNLGSSPEIIPATLGEYGAALGACLEAISRAWKKLGIDVGNTIDPLQSVASRLLHSLEAHLGT